jgi:hypothetical protein
MPGILSSELALDDGAMAAARRAGLIPQEGRNDEAGNCTSARLA